MWTSYCMIWQDSSHHPWAAALTDYVAGCYRNHFFWIKKKRKVAKNEHDQTPRAAAWCSYTWKWCRMCLLFYSKTKDKINCKTIQDLHGNLYIKINEQLFLYFYKYRNPQTTSASIGLVLNLRSNFMAGFQTDKQRNHNHHSESMHRSNQWKHGQNRN